MLNYFSFFLTDDFLERLNENPICGLEWIRTETKNDSELCKFIMRNSKWFNYWYKELIKECY